MNRVFLIGIMFLITINLKAQSKIESIKTDYDFWGFTFYASSCNGSCSDISMNIHGDSTIEISRAMYKSKGVKDPKLTGNYKGKLSDKQFNKLISLYEQVNWDTLTFPDIKCCDRQCITFLINSNGNMKVLKSMEPPVCTQMLINFLIKLGESKEFPKYDKPIDFEMINE